jgi:cell division protein FtsB
MIDKMDERIKKLSHDNNKKNSQIDDLQSELSKMDYLKERINSIVRMYGDL